METIRSCGHTIIIYLYSGGIVEISRVQMPKPHPEAEAYYTFFITDTIGDLGVCVLMYSASDCISILSVYI